MANLAKALARSKAQRDAAKALITSDVAFIKNDVVAKSVKDRAVGWSKTRPPELGEQAIKFAKDNQGRLMIGAGAVVAAIGLIMFRKPIADLATGLFEVLAEMEELETVETQGGDDGPVVSGKNVDPLLENADTNE